MISSCRAFAGRLVLHGLVFEPHRVFDGGLPLPGAKLGTFAHGFRKRLFGNQRVDKPAAKRFGGALKGIKRHASARFRLLQFNDARLGYAEPAGELLGSHAERVAHGAQPALGRALGFSSGRRVAKRLSRWRMASFMR